MGFRYFCEKRKFELEWEKLEKEYAAAGMEETAISLMKIFDWQWFCSRRVYDNHIQDFPNESMSDETVNSTLLQKFTALSVTFDLEDLNGRYDWIETIGDRKLYQNLCSLTHADLELLTLIVMDGYTQAEIARLYGCSRNAIYKRMRKIKKILQRG